MYNYVKDFNPIIDCKRELKNFLCWDCSYELQCIFAFDCYNFGDACLMDK